MISGIRITIAGGTEEEVQALTDAITLLLVEHGVDISSMKQWGTDGSE